MFTKTLKLLYSFFSNDKFTKYLRISISIFFYAFMANIIYKNIEFLNSLRNINYIYIVYLIVLIFLRLLIKSAQQQYLYKVDLIDIPFKESLKIYIYKTIGNNFLNFGSIYKISYLKNTYNVPLKKYVKLNLTISVVEIFFLTSLFFYLLTLNNIIVLNYQILLLFVLLPVFFIFLLKYLFNLNILKNIKSFVLLKLVTLTVIFHAINLLIYKFYFETLFLNKETIQSTIYYLVGFFINLVSITPGNLGYFEFVQIQAINFHSLNVKEILAVSTVNRVLGYLVIIVLFLYTRAKDTT